MTDNILCSGLLSMMAAMAVAAGASLARPGPAAHVAAAPSVVQLPPVAVTGRRIGSIETVILAQRAEND